MNRSTTTIDGIEFHKVNSDINGNPRYVTHFLNIPVNEFEIAADKEYGFKIEKQYRAAIKKAKNIGGREYTAKWFGGGIVFQSDSLNDLARSIHSLVNN